MLFAVLASSLFLAIGISMFNIAIKELAIATSERDSQIAYYAADSARECAIYFDTKLDIFQNYFNFSSCLTTSPVITCNGTSTTLLFIGSRNNNICTYTLSPTTFFYYSTTTLNLITEPEAGASITKIFNTNNGTISNTISAFGHNTGVVGRRVERSISGQY